MDPRIALVTGANRGIGLEVARQLAAAGVSVFVGARRPEQGRQAAVALRAEGLDATFVQLDVLDASSVTAAARRIEADHGRLDILVNNAAAGLDFTPPSEVDLDSMRSTLETNVIGPVRVLQTMLPLLRLAPAARVVNVSSDFGSLTLNSQPDTIYAKAISLAYPVSKAALNQVTVQFTKELRGTSIRVNSVNPGFTETAMVNDVGLHTDRMPVQAAQPIVELALAGDDCPEGGFFDEHGAMPW